MNTPLIELRDVHMSFEATPVLAGVSFAVQPQERFVIVGQSGAGKTTILRLILGLIAPTSGAVLINGRDIASITQDELRQIRHDIGMVFEEAALLSSLSVRENLAFPLQELTSKTEGAIAQIIDEKLKLVGLAGEGGTLPSELSGGMRKRFGLARALVTNPHLILFDEPTAGLDPITSAVIEKLIISLTQQTKVTSIIATPVIRTATRLATRIAMLAGGKIIQCGTAAEFMQSTNPIVAQYIAASSASSRFRSNSVTNAQPARAA